MYTPAPWRVSHIPNASDNPMGRLSGAGETFGQCVDSIRQRHRSGWLAPGPIFKRIDEVAA